jgi:sugar lactone lactonase YvrE
MALALPAAGTQAQGGASPAASGSPAAAGAPGSVAPQRTPGPGTIALPDGWQPEGITSDGDTLYVGSIADGAIWRGSASAGTGDAFIDGVAGRVAVGVDHESGADRLWVAGGGTGEVRAYDATTGEQLGAWQVATAGQTFLNDLVATPTAVYVTDSMAAELDVIPLGPHGSLPPPDGATKLPLTGDYRQVEGFNANGIVFADGRLVVVQSATGTLYRVDPASGEATAIDLGGASLVNGDGLELGPAGVFVVRNQSNLVALVMLDQALGSGTVVGEVTSPDLDIPSTAAWSGDRLYVVNARFATQPGPNVPYWITPLEPPEATPSVSASPS